MKSGNVKLWVPEGTSFADKPFFTQSYHWGPSLHSCVSASEVLVKVIRVGTWLGKLKPSDIILLYNDQTHRVYIPFVCCGLRGVPWYMYGLYWMRLGRYYFCWILGSLVVMWLLFWGSGGRSNIPSLLSKCHRFLKGVLLLHKQSSKAGILFLAVFS
jgi:hypothetical protein